MKKIIHLIVFAFAFQYAIGQQGSQELDTHVETDFTNFPKSKIKFWTRSRHSLNSDEIGVLENGVKVSKATIKNIDSLYKPVPKNKYVLILVQNHYSSKGISQRNFFKYILTDALENKIQKGDKYLVATFDWYRNGKYLFFPGGTEFTDDYDKLTETILSISSPSYLGNKQEGSDIYNALDEGLKFYSSVKDTLPKNILLLSDDLPNIVSNVQPATIVEKSLQLDIPIYAVSHNIGYSRYNQIMRDKICELSNGDYFISEKNDLDESGEMLEDFIKGMNANSLGSFRQVTYESGLKRTGEKFKVTVEIKDYPSRDFDIRYPFHILEWIKEKPLLFALYLIAFIALVLGIVYFFKYLKKKKIQSIAKEIEFRENQLKSQQEIQMLQDKQFQLTSKYESEKSVLQKKLRDENLTRKLDLLGLSCQLVYTYENRSTVIPMKGIQFSVGRASTNDLVLDMPFISKNHLKIEFAEDGQFYVTDLNSTNGTLLNNVRVSGTSLINNGDLISIGKVDIKFSQVKAKA